MFCSKERLRKRTPQGGIDRATYIEHLVEEFHTSTNVEAQEQVTANLANFAYDPINYCFLKKSGSVEVFLQLLKLPNDRLALHGIAGLCNICLDPQSKILILNPENFKLITNLLNKENSDIIVNCITLLILLLVDNIDLKPVICTPGTVSKIRSLKSSTTLTISKLATIFTEDYCTKLIETINNADK